MSFFDTKEEVLDVQLTQFGKRMLSIGHFKPVFYAFFDDDILYNSEKAGFSESQNSSQKRIIEETPKLKTQHLTTGVLTFFQTLEAIGALRTSDRRADLEIPLERIEEEGGEEEDWQNLMDAMGSIINLEAPDFESVDSGLEGMAQSREQRRANRRIEEFRDIIQIRRNHDYDVQERILLYPLGSQEVANPQAPSYDTVCLDTPIEFKGFQHFTGSGIIKNVPQFDVEPNVELIKNTTHQGVLSPPSEEVFYDLTSDEVVFRDNSMIQIRKDNLVLDVEELNTMFRKDKFRLEIYEIKQENQKEKLEKIVSPSKIRSLFHIKTDKTISDLHDYKTQREKNYQSRSRD